MSQCDTTRIFPNLAQLGIECAVEQSNNTTAFALPCHVISVADCVARLYHTFLWFLRTTNSVLNFANPLFELLPRGETMHSRGSCAVVASPANMKLAYRWVAAKVKQAPLERFFDEQIILRHVIAW